MSYILDALKKSDQERKQGDVPNLQTIHIPIKTEPSAPLGLYGVIAFLLLVLAFVVGLVLANKEPQGIVVVPDIKQPVEVKQAPVIIASSVDLETEVIKPKKLQLAAVKKTLEVVQQNTNLPVAEPEPARSGYNKAEAELHRSKPVTTSRVSVPDLSDIPYLHELADYQQQSVPQMIFAGHVYSSDPDSRSVIINDAFMSEGDSVIQGIKVIRITQSGVVFSLHDDYFRMDVLQDWSFE